MPGTPYTIGYPPGESFYKALSDKELFALVKACDEPALAELWRRYYDTLLNISRANGATLQEAEDVLQNTFFWLWENAPDITFTRSLGRYLKRMVRNNTRKLRRYERVRENYIMNVVGSGTVRAARLDTADNLFEAGELKERLDARIELLQPRCAQVFRMSRDQGLSNGEIARALGVSSKTVRDQLSIATRALKSVVREWRSEEVVCGAGT